MEKWSDLEVKVYRNYEQITQAFAKERYLLLISNLNQLEIKMNKHGSVRMVSRFVINDGQVKNVFGSSFSKNWKLCLYDREQKAAYHERCRSAIELLLKNGYIAISAVGLGFVQNDKLYAIQLRKQVAKLLP